MDFVNRGAGQQPLLLLFGQGLLYAVDVLPAGSLGKGSMVAILGFELLDELCDDAQQVLCRSMFIQRSKLVDRLFRAGLTAGQQVGNGAVALRVPDFCVTLVLAFHKSRVVGLVELTFHLREGRRQIIRVLWVKNRTETVEAVPVDVALGSFRVDVLTVGKVETAVIVLGVVSAVCSGSSGVSCQFQMCSF